MSKVTYGIHCSDGGEDTMTGKDKDKKEGPSPMSGPGDKDYEV